ncbi:hypothetical protein [cf. Phormidesmis sp. LEGE 11477]|uniref:hypothetical protein n=1 Tax=cf. Phormidesmis sp. LEGE 11477 TaxID=1828680 RepID=UPI00187F40A9|nr:hypothetical protein [cf. Phormidesmis sp. LEGE 11477]MBE9064594.1 hypothetical protein [cf. Phormidesmis sp. LEGE 11477]
MAWAFSLSVECGQLQNAAERFAAYFEGAALTLSTGSHAQCDTTIFKDMDENWWCRVCPSDVSQIGIEAPDTAYLMTELGILLYQRLRMAPPFRYGIVGIEVDEFRTYTELLEDLPTVSFPGLVMAEDIWRAIASPSTFRSFTQGYVWQPYEGEVYKPLTVSDVLKEQMRDLFVA